MRIDVVVVDDVPLGVDTPHDLERARAILAARPKAPLTRFRIRSCLHATRSSPIRASPAPTPTSPAATSIPDWEPLPCATFEDAFAAIKDGAAELGMIPIENSIAGRVADIHHFLPASGLHIIGEYFLPIHFQLLAIKGASLATIKSVYSHVHALGQCRKIIRKLGLKPVITGDTAGSAREVAEWNDPTRASLAAALAAEIYGLEHRWRRRRGRGAQHDPLRRPVADARLGASRQAARRSRRSCSASATCPPRSTRRWAASPPTAST